MSSGILSKVSFKIESVWGTPVTPDKSIAVHAGDGIQTDNDVQMPVSIKAQLAKNSTAFIGARKHEGSFDMDFVPGYIGYFLKSLFGSLTSGTKAGETIVYEHALAEAETKPSLTIEQSVGDITRRFAGAIVTGMKLASKTGAAVTASFDVKAKSSASATAISPTYETIRPFNFADCATATGFKIGGTAFDEVEAFEIDFKNGVEMSHAHGSADPAFTFVNGGHVVSGKVDLYLNSDSAAKYAEYLNNTQSSIELNLVGDAIGSASNYKLNITIPRAHFKAANFPITEGKNMITVEFEGVYDTVTSKLISGVLTNLTAAYT